MTRYAQLARDVGLCQPGIADHILKGTHNYIYKMWERLLGVINPLFERYFRNVLHFKIKNIDNG